MRILLSEGASTSAREAITALGLAGHHVEVCDPDPHCLARFSRFVRKLHRCPPLGADPQGYLAFILERDCGRTVRRAAADPRAGAFAGEIPRANRASRRNRAAKLRQLPARPQQARVQPDPHGARPAAACDPRRRRRQGIDGGETLPDGPEDPGRHRQPGHLDGQGRRPTREGRRRHRGCRWLCAIADRPGCGRGRCPAVAGGVRRRAAGRVARLSPDRARRRGRRLAQGERQQSCRARPPCAHRRTSALARRPIGRLHRRPGVGHALLLRLQSAAGRADERRVRRARSCGAAVAGVARRDAGVRRRQQQRRPHPHCCAGLAGLCGCGGEPAEPPARMLAASGQTRALCRKQRRADAGRDRLAELRAADRHRALAAGDAGRRALPCPSEDGDRIC